MLTISSDINKMFFIGLLITVFGSTFPDWDLKIFGQGSSPEGFINIWGHRGVMHYYKTYLFLYLLMLSGLFTVSIFYGGISFIWFFAVSCFIFACLAHILEDSVTTVGVPIYKVVINQNGEYKTEHKKKIEKALYKPFSFKIGNFDSAKVGFVAWGITIFNITVSIYLFYVKHIVISLGGGYHA
jgi:hypothetical protein